MLAAVMAAIARAARAGLRGVVDFFQRHGPLVRAIAEAAGNPILAVLMETVVSAMYDDRRRTVEQSSDLRQYAEMHRTIYRAIRARDAASARKAMEQHLHLAQSAQVREPAPQPHNGARRRTGTKGSTAETVEKKPRRH